MAKLRMKSLPEAATAAISEDGDGGGDEAFVGFEAPMFVDLADPDRCRVDDPSWFCTRIGCDQNHAQVDPEELERDFRLRVMAARSPNVRMYKSLHSTIQRCPQSAPAKSRIPRFCSNHCAGGEIAKDKLRNHPVNGLRATPKSKIVASVARKEGVKASAPRLESRTPASKAVGRSKFVALAKNEGVKFKPELSECRTPASEAGSKVRKREVASRYLLSGTKNLKSCVDLGANGSARKLDAVKSTAKNDSKHRKKCNADHVDVACGDENSQVEMPEQGTVGGSQKPSLALEATFDAAEISVKKASMQEEQEAEKSTQKKATRHRRKWNVEHADAPCTDENSQVEELEQNTPGSSHKPMLISPSKMDAEIPVNGTGAAVFELHNDGADDDDKENAQQIMLCENVPPKVVKTVKKASCGKVEQHSKIKKTTSPKPFRLRTDERRILKDANLGQRQLVTGQHKNHADVLTEKFPDSKVKKLNNTRSISTDQATSRPEKLKRTLGFLSATKSTNPNSTIVPRVQGVKPFGHHSKAPKTAANSLKPAARAQRVSCCVTQKVLAEEPRVKVR